MSRKQQPYYLGSILGPLILGNSLIGIVTGYGLCHLPSPSKEVHRGPLLTDDRSPSPLPCESYGGPPETLLSSARNLDHSQQEVNGLSETHAKLIDFAKSKPSARLSSGASASLMAVGVAFGWARSTYSHGDAHGDIRALSI